MMQFCSGIMNKKQGGSKLKPKFLLVIFAITISLISAQSVQEVAITSGTSGNQNNPMVASSDDCFSIVWEDYRAGASNPNIYGISVDSIGTTSSLFILCVASGLQNTPAVEYNSGTSEFMNIWFDQRTATQLYAINSTCSATSGSEWLVDDITANLSSPEIAFSGTNYLYVWMFDNSGSYEIRYLVLDNTGSPVGAVQTLSATGFAKNPDVAYDGSEFLITWEDSTASGKGIYGKYFDSSGSSISSSFLLIDDNFASAPGICGITAGNKFAISWVHYDGTTNNDIYSGILPHLSTSSITGNAVYIGNEAQSEPDIAWDGNSFLVVWKDNRASFSTDIYGRFLDSLGTPVETDFAICDSASSQRTPKLAYSSPAKKYFCVWADGRNGSNDDIYGALINAPAPPDTFQLVGELDNISATQKVEVSGNYAFLPARYDGTSSLLAVDVSDSSNPIIVAATAIPGAAYGMGLEIIDTLVCLSTSDGYLHIFDFNTDTLVLIGTYDIKEQGAEVVGRDTMVWVCAYDTIRWLSISDPTAPYQLATFAASSQFNGLSIQDTFLFTTEAISTGGSRFRILRANDPSQFWPAGSVNLNGYGKDVDGDYTTGYMFVADGVTQATNTGRMISIDVSTISSPDSAGIFQSDGATIGAISVKDTFAYLANDTLGVKIADVADPTNPSLASTIVPPAPSTKTVDVFVYGRFLYVLTDSALLIYRINLGGPEFSIQSWVFGDSSDGDGYFEPGETLGLTVVVENTGTEIVDNAWMRASISSGDATVNPPDSFWFGSIDVGVQDTGYFEIIVSSSASAPSQIQVQLAGHSSNGGNPSDIATANITDTSPIMEITSWVFGDSSDGDGYFEVGETLGLTIEVKNTGIDVLHSAWVRTSILSGDGSILPPDSVYLGNITPDGVDTAYFNVKISDTAPTPSQLKVLINGHSSDGGDPTDTATANIVDVSPAMAIQSWVFGDSSDGDGRFEPGETLGLTVVVEDTGLDPLHDAWLRASVLSGDCSIELPDSIWIGDLNVSQQGTVFFYVDIDTDATAPSTIEILLSGHSSDGGDPTDTATADVVSGADGFYDDIESGPSNWTASEHWHIDDWDASSPTLAWFCGLTEQPLYNSNWSDTLTSRWIVVPDNSYLVVHHRYNTEDNYDYCYIDITTGGGWTVLDSFSGTSQGWVRNAYDLSSVPAGDSIRVGFRLQSDGSVVGNGWWVDDVYVGEAQIGDLYGPRCYPSVAYFQDSILFTINYQRDDGTFPTSANVHIGDSIFSMTTSDIDPSDGALYYRKVKLPPWNYSYHFEFVVPEGTVRFPRTGEIEGPYVTDTAVIHWDFEDGGHATGTGCWEYGTPTSGPGSAHSGSNLWATVLDGNYPDNSISLLRFDSFDLTGLEHPQIRMWIWYSMQSRTSRTGFRDAANAWVIHGTDTTFLNQIYEYSGIASGYIPDPVGGKPAWGDNDRGNFWHRVMFDLTPWVGDTIEFAIVFESNTYANDDGIYIDDLSLLDKYDEPPIISFNLNGRDSILWQKEAAERGQTLVSDESDSIAVNNIGNVTLDFILGVFDIDTLNFRYDTSYCYGCVSLWGYFSDNNIVPDTSDFDSLDLIRADTLLLSDTLNYGPAGWRLSPDSVDYFWLMMHTPRYFPEDTFTARILIKALQHIE